MAQLVGAYGVPHTPAFPSAVKAQGTDSETARLYAQIATHLAATGADTIVVITNDHINTFFWDNWPALCVPLAATSWGPNDAVLDQPIRQMRLATGLGETLLNRLVDNEFDPSRSRALSLDHATLVPLHFLDPDNRLAVLPLLINGMAPPLPKAGRMHRLGRQLRMAIEEWVSDARVAVLASGSFSLEVGGPRIQDDAIFGVPDPEWADRASELIRTADIDTLIAESTPKQMTAAGNVGGEILNWIVMLGAAGSREPAFLTQQLEFGHAYAAWDGARL